jgi:hypothetical protein
MVNVDPEVISSGRVHTQCGNVPVDLTCGWEFAAWRCVCSRPLTLVCTIAFVLCFCESSRHWTQFYAGLHNRPTLGTKEIHKDVSILGLTRWNRERDVAYPEVSLDTRKMLRRFLVCQLRTLLSHSYTVHPVRPTAYSCLFPHYGIQKVKRTVNEINQRPRTDVSIDIRG